MIVHFLQKEIVENVSGPKFLITLAISAVLILTSMYSGYQLYETEMRWHSRAKSENVKALTNLGSYGRLKREGAKAMRAPSPMSIFVKGVDSTIGKAATVHEGANIVLRDSRYGLNPIFAVFGELDLAFIVKMILSLFALFFSYNAISGEREMGTLKLVMSNSVGRAGFIIGKTLGGLATLLIPLLLPILLGLLMLMTVFGVNFSMDEWGRIGLMTLVFALYLSVFYLVGMLMSALTRHSFASFLLCLFFWVLSIAVIPKAAVEVAGHISPAPSIDALEAERAALKRDYYSDLKRLTTEKVSNYLDSRNQADGGQLDQAIDVAYDEAQREAMESLLSKENALLAEYERFQLGLLSTAQGLARLSPTACATFSTNRLSMTDAQLRDRFLRSLRRYREQFLGFADEVIRKNPDRSASGVGLSVRIDDDAAEIPRVDFSMSVPEFELDLAGLPQYDLNKESLNSSFADILPDIAVLIFELLVFFAAAFVAFLRYDVR